MKIKIFIIFAVLLIFVCQASATSVWISNVDVIPSQPFDTDLVTFSVSGMAANWSSNVEYEQFLQDGTSLQLDLYVNMGIVPTISSWTHSTEIQPLVPATYNLEVRALDYRFGTLQDTRTIDFTVVPEPGTLAILGFGLPFFRAFLRRKI